MCFYLLNLATLLVMVMVAGGAVLGLLCIRRRITHINFVTSFSQNLIQSQTF